MMSRKKILFRFDEARSVLEDRHLVLNDYNPGETLIKSKVEALRNLVPLIQEKDGKLNVQYNFTELAEKLGLSKGEIYRQIIIFYHQQEALREIKSTPFTKAQTNHIIEASEAPSKIEPLNVSRLDDNTSDVKSATKELEYLKLEDGDLSTAKEKSSKSYTSGGNESEHQLLTSDDSSLESNSEADNLFNIASASTLLHRSLILGHKKQKRHVSTSADDKEETSVAPNNEDDDLLSSGSLRDSVLADELLKHI